MRITIIDNRHSNFLSGAILKFNTMSDFTETCANLATIHGDWAEDILTIDHRIIRKYPEQRKIILTISTINQAHMFSEILFFVESVVKVAYMPIKNSPTTKTK